MADRVLPTQAQLRQLLDYDPETGALTWKRREPSMFRDGAKTAAHICAGWNTRYAGTPALEAHDTQGYKRGDVLGTGFLAHRVIWMWVNGYWPEQVDHINGDRKDNRIVNLREVSNAVNGKNRRLNSNNKSGISGVRRHSGGQWEAKIKIGGKMLRLGLFDTIEQAAEARRRAEVEYDFHPNHGKR